MRLLQAATAIAVSVLAYSTWKARVVPRDDVAFHTPNASLCFREASFALLRSEIKEKEYYSHLLTHLRGIRHLGDGFGNAPARRNARNVDPFASSLQEIALREDYEPVDDTNIYQSLLESCSVGDIAELQQNFEKVSNDPNQPKILQPLAVLAARSGQTAALQFCLARGASFDVNLDRAISSGSQTTTTLELLWSYNWHGIQDSPTTLNQLASENIYRPELLSWLIDHGAELDLRIYKRAALGPVSVPVMKLLVNRFGWEELKSTGSLQMAAARGDAALVAYLLEIGLDPNEVPPALDEREPISTALYEAVKGDHFEVVRTLIKNGADLDHPRRTRSSILAMASAHDDQDLVKLIITSN